MTRATTKPGPRDLKTLGALLQRCRRRCGMTQPEEARSLGVSRITVYNWECGVFAPSAEHLPALINYVEATPSEAIEIRALACGRRAPPAFVYDHARFAPDAADSVWQASTAGPRKSRGPQTKKRRKT